MTVVLLALASGAACAFVAYWAGVGNTERRHRALLWAIEDLEEVNAELVERIAELELEPINERDGGWLTPHEHIKWIEITGGQP